MRCIAGRLDLAASRQHAVIVDPLTAIRQRDLFARRARDLSVARSVALGLRDSLFVRRPFHYR